MFALIAFKVEEIVFLGLQETIFKFSTIFSMISQQFKVHSSKWARCSQAIQSKCDEKIISCRTLKIKISPETFNKPLKIVL